MFSILTGDTPMCDGISRRELLRVGGLGLCGATLPRLLQATESNESRFAGDPTFGRAKNVIYVWLQGGPPQHETFDPKPLAPREIRGAFQPIQTNIPGVDFCELLPRTAQMADKLAIVRSMVTNSNIHSVSSYEVLTGYKYRGPNARTITPQDWPYFGSIIKMMKPSGELPSLSTVWLPQKMRLNENVTPAGQTAGFLGRQWDPERFTGDPSRPEFRIQGMETSAVAPLRLKQRQALLGQVQEHFATLDRGRPVGVFDQYQGQAFDLLISGKAQRAFDIHQEPAEIRDRYGRHKWGQCLLLGRRLIEAGVRLVHVNWVREPGDSAVDNPMWDTHAQNFDRVEDVLCPMFDVGFTALIDDLDQRGLLDETLVVAIGEFGRTPRINGAAGRDHWGNVFSFALAGAGIQTGQVYGASDRNGGFPARDPVTPGDLSATIFHLLGIPYDAAFTDPEGREHRITGGAPIWPIIGEGVATTKRHVPTGDITRVPPFNDSLLLNTEFADGAPLRPTDLGSRPKGWRGRPLVGTALQVKLLEAAPNSTDSGSVALGYGIDGPQDSVKIEPGAMAILAQEMRNPRLGRFRFRIDASGHGTNRDYFENVFLANFRCRLVIYRYNSPSKDPLNRSEFISTEFVPPYSDSADPQPQTFEVERLLDSPGPGQNFPIGNGYGVAIIVEPKFPQNFDLPANQGPHSGWIRITSVQLDFSNRTVNDDVTV